LAGKQLADIRTRFGAKLRELRTKQGISQEDLGAIAGLHRTFISMVERGERNVTIATVEKLAKALGCRMGDLMPDPPLKR
jgi:transcriptional regulator with XRE-family HTH domain